MTKRYIISCTMAAVLFILCGAASCHHGKKDILEPVTVDPKGPQFDADSALAFCYGQCAFGPRTMNSTAHDECEQWIIDMFKRYGCEVETQKATLKGYDGTPLRATNIIAHYQPDKPKHILICAHWDSRPWADNDPDEANWHTPVLAANDGASGVAVMIELARVLQQVDSLDLGIDFICFDAEDWGVPQWSDRTDENSWALGAQYWAEHQEPKPYTTAYGILLDMVGGQGAEFYQEGMSQRYAPQVVQRVWNAAHAAGYSQYFPRTTGGGVTDDHLPINEKAGIPTIDIIPHYPNCRESSFGPTWHTIADDMDHIDSNTLKAVGQTIIQVLFTE